jgi:hypothetical protein
VKFLTMPKLVVAQSYLLFLFLMYVGGHASTH